MNPYESNYKKQELNPLNGDQEPVACQRSLFLRILVGSVAFGMLSGVVFGVGLEFAFVHGTGNWPNYVCAYALSGVAVSVVSVFVLSLYRLFAFRFNRAMRPAVVISYFASLLCLWFLIALMWL